MQLALPLGRNEVDSHNAAGLLAASGYELVESMRALGGDELIPVRRPSGWANR